jgi:MFS family permease
MLIPLALTQFVASFAGSSMNVSISAISKDLGTTVHGVQTAITLFLLCMAALMIPGSKLTDIFSRKRCLLWGLTVYGTGAVIAALAPALGVLVVGYSGFEGVGSALIVLLSRGIADPPPADRIETGAIFTAATAGILISSLAAERLAKRHAQGTLISSGFLITLLGIGLLLALAREGSSVWTFVPGLLFIGLASA